MSYVIAIPSYNRVNIIISKTLKFLKDGDINSKIIYIFVANKDEYDKYKKGVPKELYNEIIIGKKGISNQRNFITKYFKEGEHIISIDDDIEELFKLKKNGSFMKIKKLDIFFIEAFDRLKKEKLFIWGIYPTKNPHFMFHSITIDLRFIIGAFYGFINRHSKDIETGKVDAKEDIERSILYYKKDGGVLRYNNMAVKTKFLAEGGLGKVKERIEMNNNSAKILEKKYPDILKLYYRNNGMAELKIIRNRKNTIKRKTIKNSKNNSKTKKIKK